MTKRTVFDNCFDTVVIGASQSGLAAGYHLSRTNQSFILLDANARPGDTWRRRWDPLRLSSPAQWDSLPGQPFPAPTGTYPTKDEMADYLDGYANRFKLPIAHGVRVMRISRDGGEMLIECADRYMVSRN